MTYVHVRNVAHMNRQPYYSDVHIVKGMHACVPVKTPERERSNDRAIGSVASCSRWGGRERR
jgi:hypothetical protein